MADVWAMAQQRAVGSVGVLEGLIAALVAKVCAGVSTALVREYVQEADLDDVDAVVFAVILQTVLIGSLAL